MVDADRTKKNPNRPVDDPPENTGDNPLPNSAVDDFFVKINHDFRRPKPSEEAVAAALHAIQTLASDAAVEPAADAALTEDSSRDATNRDAHDPCPKCGAVNSGANRFCGYCGSSLLRRERPASQTAPPPSVSVHERPAREQHIHHHHHHYFPESMVKHAITGETTAALSGEPVAPQPAVTAEAAIQKLVTDWTLCCNSKRLDDLLALYSPDAILLRPNVSPAHGRSAIRLLLQASLQAGLGDVELDPADAGVLGDIACLTGISRMLVPTGPGKRHEETGKFLFVARREGSQWKILADSWCMDSVPKLSAPATVPAPAARDPHSK